MSNDHIEFFAHSPGAKPKVVKAPATERLEDALTRAGINLAGDKALLVFVGECEDAKKDKSGDDNTTDSQEPVDTSRTLGELGVGPRTHVHCHCCRHIKVEVRFNSSSKHRSFAPSATVGTATVWAKHVFKVDAASDFVLKICGTAIIPRENEELGDLVTGNDCTLCFELVAEVTPQG